MRLKYHPKNHSRFINQHIMILESGLEEKNSKNKKEINN